MPDLEGAGTSGRGPRALRRWLGGIPRTVWLVTALFALLLVAYSLIFPAYRGPDEPQHVDLSLFVRERLAYPDVGDRFLAGSVEESMRVVRFGRDSRHLTEEAAPPRDERPPLDDVEETGGGRINQMPQHPPLYYGGMAVGTATVDTLIPGDVTTRPFDRTVAMMRVLNALLIVPIPILAFLVVRRLGGSADAGVAAALVPVGIPQLLHIGSAVNNDNLLSLLFGVLTVLVVGVARGRTSTWVALGVGGLAGAALLTKGFAFVAPFWIGAAYLVAGWRTGQWRRAGVNLAVAMGTLLAVGGWWWIRNAVVFGTVQPGVRLLPDAPPSFEPEALWWLRRFGAWIVERFWGWFGWFDVRMPLAAIVAGAVVVGVGVLAALVMRRRLRADIVLLLVPMVGIALIVAFGAYQSYARTGLTPAIQGRYLFPGVVGLAAGAGLGLSALTGTGRRWLPPALLGGGAAMHLVALRAVMPVYWGPTAPASVGDRLGAMLAWSPWPAALWWGIVGATLAGGLWLLVELLSQARRAAPTDPESA